MDLKQLVSPSNFKSIMTKAQTHPYIKPIEKKKKNAILCKFQLARLVESLVVEFGVQTSNSN